MIDELIAAIAGYISGQSIDRPKRTRLYTSIILGGIFFLINFTRDLIERNIKVDNILVLLGLSIFVGLFSYIVLFFYKPDSKNQAYYYKFTTIFSEL